MAAGLKISLDASALQLMIDRDPGFEVELQRSVIGNIAKRHIRDSEAFRGRAFEEAIQKARDEIQREVFAQVRSVKADMLEMTKREVEKINVNYGDPLSEKYQSFVNKAIKDRVVSTFGSEKDLESLVSSKLGRLVDSIRITNLGLSHEVGNKLRKEVRASLIEELKNLGLSESTVTLGR